MNSKLETDLKFYTKELTIAKKAMRVLTHSYILESANPVKKVTKEHIANCAIKIAILELDVFRTRNLLLPVSK